MGIATILQGKDAETLYYLMILVGLGLARSCVDGCAPLHLQQVSEILGKNVRAFLMVIRAGADERESFMPQKGVGPDGDSAIPTSQSHKQSVEAQIAPPPCARFSWVRPKGGSRGRTWSGER